MFEGKSEQKAREEILQLIKEYAENFHNRKKSLYPFGNECYQVGKSPSF